MVVVWPVGRRHHRCVSGTGDVVNYTGQSPIISPGRATSTQIQAWFDARGPGYAEGYAPDGLYVPPPDSLGRDIVAECARYPEHVVNHDLVSGQILKETAGWQSEYARYRNNPGGLGATNDNPDNAIWFKTPAEGIRAHVAHVLTYAVGEGPWTEDDERFEETPAKWRGIADVITDLNGRWAYPGRSYGQGIARLANELLETADVPEVTVAKPTMIPRPSPNRDGYDELRRIEAIVNHIATGSKASNLSWLTNSNSGVSCNAYIAKDGTISEMVPITSSPWTNGPVREPDLSNPVIAGWVRDGVNPNTRTYTIEHEGQPGDQLTELQIASNNRVTAWVAATCDLSINRTTIIGHYQIDNVNKPYCPSFSATEWKRLIDGANALLENGAPLDTGDSAMPALPSTEPDPWGTPNWIPTIFVNYIRANDWMEFGWCLSPAVGEGNKIVQYFERARLELQPDGTITRGLVGLEAMHFKYGDTV